MHSIDDYDMMGQDRKIEILKNCIYEGANYEHVMTFISKCLGEIMEKMDKQDEP